MTDILFDNDYDLAVLNGDFEIGESVEQEVEDIIISFPGWFKQFPLVGVSAPLYLKGPANLQNLQRNIQLQLQGDGKQVQQYSLVQNNDGSFTITINGVEIDVS